MSFRHPLNLHNWRKWVVGPSGQWLQLYVVDATTRQVTVREAQGKSGQFDYLVQGVRSGYENYQPIRPRHLAKKK